MSKAAVDSTLAELSLALFDDPELIRLADENRLANDMDALVWYEYKRPVVHASFTMCLVCGFHKVLTTTRSFAQIKRGSQPICGSLDPCAIIKSKVHIEELCQHCGCHLHLLSADRRAKLAAI